MQFPCIIRVLVVDNDPETRNQLVKILRGAKYHVQAAEGQGMELRESAKNLAFELKPHVVVMDLRLADEHADDRSGLDLWKDESFSFARCILYSAYLNQDYKITREALRQEGVEDVIGKEDSPQVLVDAVERVARGACGCRNGLSIAWPSAWNEEAVLGYLFKEVDTLPRDLVLDVFGRLFPDTKSITLKALEGSTQSSVVMGHGRTVLFQAWPDDREPLVVKLAPRKRISREIKAYEQFIEERLAGRFYAELQKHNVFWDLGGICYSFMGSSQKSLKTFTTFYRETDASKEIIKPLEHFFEEVWRPRYRDSRPLQAESLFEAYNPSQKLRQRLETFPVQGETISFPGIPGDYINPALWILRHEADSHFHHAKQATIHGDLHGDNLFVDEDHAWAIDFERSGAGHVLRDFVELEQNIVTRLIELPETDLRLFYRVAMLLTRPVFPTEPVLAPEYFEKDEQVTKGLEVINGLRAIAHRVTNYEDMHEYYWGLLLDTSFSLMLAEPYSPRWRRGLLFASMLCTRLKEWGRRWPPANWPSIENHPAGQHVHEHLAGMESGLQRKESGGNVTNVYVGGNFDGNLSVGDSNRSIMDSYNKIASAKIDPELKETLEMLAKAVAEMNKALPEEQAAETSEDLGRLVDEAIKPRPRNKWYSVSIEGLIKAAENVEKVGEPVINLSRMVLSILAGI